MSVNPSTISFPNAGQVEPDTDVIGFKTSRPPSRYRMQRITEHARQVAVSGRQQLQVFETFGRVEVGWRGLRMLPSVARDRIQYGGFQAWHAWDQRGGPWSFALDYRKARESWISSSANVGTPFVSLYKDGSTSAPEGTYREIGNQRVDDWAVGDRVWIIGDSADRRAFGFSNTWEVRTISDVVVNGSVQLYFDEPLIFQVYRLDRVLHEGYFPSCARIDRERNPVAERDAGRGPFTYDVRFEFQEIKTPDYPDFPRFE